MNSPSGTRSVEVIVKRGNEGDYTTEIKTNGMSQVLKAVGYPHITLNFDVLEQLDDKEAIQTTEPQLHKIGTDFVTLVTALQKQIDNGKLRGSS